MLLRLILRQFSVRRGRTVLTLLAIAFSVSLVVAVTSGFASLSAVALRMVDRYMGSTDVFITARNVQKTTFAGKVLEDVRADPRVRKAVGRFETNSPLLDLNGQTIVGRSSGLIGLTLPEDSGGANLTLTAGQWFSGSSGKVAVLNANAARLIRSPADATKDSPQVTPGTVISIPGPSGPLEVTVVGIVHQPEIAGNTIYLPLDTLRDWVFPDAPRGQAGTRPGEPPAASVSGQPKPLTRVMVELKKGDDLAAFETEWAGRLKADDPNIRVKLARTNKDQIEKNLMGLTMLSALGVSVSVIAAACIVFTTLSMGVAERQRQLAMLRAIGALRGQIGKLVVLEGLLLALGGVAAGVPLGYLWVKLLTLQFSQVFTAGVVLSLAGVAYALVACVGTALLATLLPAWQAARVSPLEAMAPLASGGSGGGRWHGKLALIGLALILVAPPINLSGVLPAAIRMVWPGMTEAVGRGMQFYGHFAVGVPLIIVGFFLLSPMVIRLVETGLVPVAARGLALPRSLLRQQLGGGGGGGGGSGEGGGGGGGGGDIWRAAGTACALMIGLATLVVMQVQGKSALGAWKLPDRFPDVFILHRGLGGLNADEVDKLARMPGIRPGELMPVAIASPVFGNNFLAIAGAVAMPESTLFFGLDPSQARRMTELEYRQGDPDTAVGLLRRGRHVLITEEFRQIKGLGVGDTIELKTRNAGVVKFTIAGVVWSPGIDVMVSVFDLGGSFDSRTAYSVFGTLEDARDLFGVDQISVFAANLESGIEREALTKRLQADVGKMGLQAYDIRQVKAAIQNGLGNLLLMASSVAFAALFVASLGVTNTVMAGIRSRRWQFGVLRAVGVSRGQLLRLVIAESILLGVAATTLGLACGAWLVINSRTMTRIFIGLSPDVVIPWPMVLIGVGSVLFVALAASIYPATNTARKPVLELLQAGRASA